MNSIGTRLKKLRLSMKKTLAEESKNFNVCLNTVYRWEHDLCVPKKSTLIKIASYYDVPLEWLLYGNENETNRISMAEEDNKCDGCILNPERNTEQKILKMLRKLSNNSKYKIIGYIERMCIEHDDEE